MHFALHEYPSKFRNQQTPVALKELLGMFTEVSMVVDAVVDSGHQTPPSKLDVMEGHRLPSIRASLGPLAILGRQCLWRSLRPLQTYILQVVNNM